MNQRIVIIKVVCMDFRMVNKRKAFCESLTSAFASEKLLPVFASMIQLLLYR
jgi:hypothetical protein